MENAVDMPKDRSPQSNALPDEEAHPWNQASTSKMEAINLQVEIAQGAHSQLKETIQEQTACPEENGENVHALPRPQVYSAVPPCFEVAEIQAKQHLQQAMDTTHSQLLHALHQAALDIVEHLGQDAARRVLLAERKATAFEQELCGVRQQALFMLLRLKAEGEAQVVELEKKFLNERRRAQNADAKLATAQDMLARLNSELKRKDEILDKMQKLVRPVSGSLIDEGCKPDGKLDCLYSKQGERPCFTNVDGSRSIRKGDSSKKGISSMKTVRMNMQTCQPSVLHPCETGEVAAKVEKEKRRDRSTIERDSMRRFSQDKWQLHQELDGSSINPKYVKGSLAVESSAEETSLIHNDQAMNANEQQRSSVVLDLKKGDCQASFVCTASKNSTLAAQDLDRSFYDDAPGKSYLVSETSPCPHNADGEAPEGLGTCLANHYSPTSTLTEGRDSREACEASSCEFRKDGHLDILESDQLLCSQKHSENSTVQPEQSGGLCLLGDIIDGKDSTAFGTSKNRVKEISETLTEFAGPDFEIVASLAELAVGNGCCRDHAGEASVSHASKEEIDSRPRTSGPRMKRKRSFSGKKDGSTTQRETKKELKVDERFDNFLDSNIKHYTRRPRVGFTRSPEDSLAVESSRDSRRLMQGARQLLCLSERKW